jgi:hypothetical protein
MRTAVLSIAVGAVLFGAPWWVLVVLVGLAVAETIGTNR